MKPKPTFAEVARELKAKLGKPIVRKGVGKYPATDDAKAWVKRVHETTGSAAVVAMSGKNYLLVVDGSPSPFLEHCTWVTWQSRGARAMIDRLHDEVRVRIPEVKYTSFLMQLGAVPADPKDWAERFAKLLSQADPRVIAKALVKKRWRTSNYK